MEKEEKQNENGEREETSSKTGEHEFWLQWGKRRSICRKVSSRFVSDTSTTNSPFRVNRVTEGSGNGKSPSPEKEKYYSTRGSSVGEEKDKGGSSVNVNGNGVGVGVGIDNLGGGDRRNKVWPKLYISLSSKEKEEDFLAMKGCKLPQRPKKRAKVIQRTLLLVSPGAWLTDMCQERYEVREKKTPKKRPRGLKAMGNALDTDSE